MSLLTPPIATPSGEQLFWGVLHSQAQLCGTVTLGHSAFLWAVAAGRPGLAGPAQSPAMLPFFGLKTPYLQSISLLPCLKLS